MTAGNTGTPKGMDVFPTPIEMSGTQYISPMSTININSQAGL